jgi:hypothetical protein
VRRTLAAIAAKINHYKEFAMSHLLSEMSEYFSDPECETFGITREEWQTLNKELAATDSQQPQADILKLLNDCLHVLDIHRSGIPEWSELSSRIVTVIHNSKRSAMR